MLSQHKESANEHGTLDSDVFGIDRQDQESTKGSSEPLEVRDNSSDARQDKNLVGTKPLVPMFTGMLLSRLGSTVGENTPSQRRSKVRAVVPVAMSRATSQILATL